MKKKIFVALQTFSEYSPLPLQRLKESGMEIIMNDLKHRLNRQEIISLGKDADGIIAGVEPYDREVLSALVKLKCISRCGVGTDNIDLACSGERGIKILNTPDAVVQPVAEMTIAMIFDLLRHLTFHANSLKQGVWKKKAGHLLAGRKIGVIGLGRIGRKVAEMLAGLKADVYGNDIKPDLKWAKSSNVKILSVDEIIEISDVLSLHVSVSGKDGFYLGPQQVKKMKKGSILINTSRGQVVDEDAVCKALSSGHLAGGGFDVFSSEPYSGPLSGFDNVILTPHVSTLTEESRTEMEIQSVENLLNYFK